VQKVTKIGTKWRESSLQIERPPATIEALKIVVSAISFESDPPENVEMKSGIYLPVVLFVALALPAFAQQGSMNSASPQTAGDRDPLPAPRATNFWDGDDPNLVNLVRHPFATKSYVERQTRPIRDRVNELDQITAENSANIKDVDARAQKGLQMASEKTSLADQHATDAATRAQAAQLAANQAATRVSSVEQTVGSLDQYKGSAQTEIRFRPGQHILSKSAKNALDQMAAPLANQKSYIIEIRGFAPGRGHASVVNSQKMANSVVRYLVLTHKIPVYRIYAMSMGNTAPATAKSRRVTSPRVEVSILQSEIASATQH
jgi:outer membrane protein OmpA-like peptidoglycan-associated protein